MVTYSLWHRIERSPAIFDIVIDLSNEHGTSSMITRELGRLCALGALLLMTAGASAATYYVDSQSGSDTADGLSPSTALQTIGAANALALAPGDSMLFRRGQAFSGELRLRRDGTQVSPISVGAYGTGATPPVVFGLLISGDYILVDGVDVNHDGAASDAIRVRSARSAVLRNMSISNGTRDAIDANEADGLLVENVEIHHFLNGSFGSGDDSHGVAITSTNGATIRQANIHHVSGDSVQVDPNRVAGAISDNIVIEDSTLWTGPLTQAFNGGWPAGASPGENALDTKVLQNGWENEIRMRLTLTNLTAYGWTDIAEINNRAAFNLKEKIDVTLDGVTVFDSEIAFRVRGSLGNADTLVANAVVYDVDIAVRAEDNLANLRVYNSTFGDGVGQALRLAGGSSGLPTWEWRNNAFVSPVPQEIAHASNLRATASDFADAAGRDYGLAANSSLADAGVTITAVQTDRNGVPRQQPYDVGAFEAGSSAIQPNPPSNFRVIQ